MPEEIKQQNANNIADNTNDTNNNNNGTCLTDSEEQFWSAVDYEAEFKKIEPTEITATLPSNPEEESIVK